LHRLASTLAGQPPQPRAALLQALRPYVEAQRRRGVALRHVGRHLLGLFHGEPGGRAFRRILTEGMHDPAAGWPLVERALQATVAPHAHAA
jgi:tRNA-dihydrouridine synthase A